MPRTLLAILALLPWTAPAAAQTGVIGVSLNIVQPMRSLATSHADVRYRAGEFVEVSTPLELGGDAGRILAVTQGTPSDEGAEDTPGIRVRSGSGRFERLDGEGGVALGTSGKVAGGEVPVVYRLDLRGKRAPKEVRLTVRYLIAPDA